jgi:hypothetical protein
MRNERRKCYKSRFFEGLAWCVPTMALFFYVIYVFFMELSK